MRGDVAEEAQDPYLAGHATVHTTARYDRRGAAAQQQAAERPHVPYIANSCYWSLCWNSG